MKDTAVAFLAKFFSMLVLVLTPIAPIMWATGGLIIADFITGIWASIKEKTPITSSGFKKTIAKMIAYQCAIIVAYVIQTVLVQDIPMVKVVAGLIGLTEGKSFFENIHRITGVDFMNEAMKKIFTATVKDVVDPKDETK